MRGGPASALDGLGPLEAAARWPLGVPLVALVSSDRSGGARARWSVLARPTGWRRLERRGGGLVWVGDGGERATTDPFADLDALAGRGEAFAGACPFTGGWIGWLGYELGEVVEPRAASGGGPVDDRGWALAELARCPAAYVHDAATDTWRVVGDAALLPGLDTPQDLVASIGAIDAETNRDGYIGAAARAVELIHAGDCFQVNLAHRLTATLEGSARGLWLELARAARPWYAGLVESCDGRRAVCSLSPELFLGVAPDGRVVTRPMKGTRPARVGVRALEASGKDRAELAMITDLMRNDLGRVCGFGSVRVESAREIELHGEPDGAGVLQGVSTVAGRLRSGVGIGGALRACFPPGSVTGAPKVRAMQVIRELEPVARGPYCGAVGYISESGHAAFSVAIRTACVSDGVVDYHAGAGIVAESDPESEWRETLDKAGAILALSRASSRVGSLVGRSAELSGAGA